MQTSAEAGKRRLATALLLGVTVIWGWTFVLVKDAVEHMPPASFLAWRFFLASLVMAPWALRRGHGRGIHTGMGIGVCLGLAYYLQTIGLDKTTASLTGLITGLFAVFAPVFNRILFRVHVHSRSWAAIGVGLTGLALLTGFQPNGFQSGDAWSLGCAAAFGLHIALLDRTSAHHPSAALTLGQMVGCAGFCAALSVGESGFVFPPRETWLALGVTAFLASALAFFAQTYAQSVLSATRAALLILLEPLFAVLFAVWFHNDHLSGLQMAGAFVLLVGVVVESLRPVAGVGTGNT